MNANRPSSRGRFLDGLRSRRLGLALGLACVLPVAAAGCNSLETWEQARKTRQNLNPPLAPDQAPTQIGRLGPKTDFHSTVGQEQKFNVHVEMAKVLESQGQYEAAIAEYQKSLEAADKSGVGRGNPKIGGSLHALAHRRMANDYGRLGRFAQAEVHFREALKLDPKDAKLWNDAGYSYYLQARYADAERTLKMAQELDPSNTRVATNLGLVLAATGREDEALAELSKANGPAAGHANLAFLLAARGQSEKARRQYQKALSLQPNLPVVKQALGRLDRDRDAKPETQIAAAALKPDANKPIETETKTASAATKPDGKDSAKADGQDKDQSVERTSLSKIPDEPPIPASSTLKLQPAPESSPESVEDKVR
jgi:Flp pilus assembly protein TadD